MATRAMHDVKFIRELSLETVMALKSKILPILTYGIEVNERNLATLESVKSTYIKRAVGVAKNTRSRLVYLLARETFLIENLRTMYPYPTQQEGQRTQDLD